VTGLCVAGARRGRCDAEDVKKVIYSDSSQIVGDEVAGVMLEYAAALASHHAAEPLTFRAVNSGGDFEDASFLLGPASQIAVERAEDGDEPDNTEAIAFMRRRITELGSAARPRAEAPDGRQPGSALDGYEL
jgi:hypothetical protein